MATILVIGGQGALGSITAQIIRERSDFTVLVGGRRREARPDFRYIDLADRESIRAALSGVDFAISTVADPHFELERVAVETGARSLSISSAVLPPGGHVSVKGNGLAVVHAGLGPLGLQALIAKELLKRHPDTARLEVAMSFSASGASGPQGREFAYTALTRRPFEPARSIPFSAPVGPLKCFSAALLDRDILQTLAPEADVGIYVGFSEPLVHSAIAALRATRLIRVLPRSLFVGRPGPSAPAQPTAEPVRHWVAVYDENGRRLRAMETAGVGDYRVTALVTLVFVRALIARLESRKPFGVHGAERLFDLADVQPLLGADVTIRAIE